MVKVSYLLVSQVFGHDEEDYKRGVLKLDLQIRTMNFIEQDTKMS